MQHNHPLIAYAYHFLCEAILIFLVALPILHHRFFFVPYGSYIIVIIGACLLFSILTKLTNNVFIYIAVAPILLIVFQVLEYPILFSLLFAGLLTWRYMDIRNQEMIRREALYILLTVILTIVVSILVHDSQIMIYPFLQFIILFVGYVASHFVHVSKPDKKKINYKIPLYFVGILGAGAALFYTIFDGLRFLTATIWRGILDGATGILLGISNMLSFWEVEQRGWPEQEPSDNEFNPEDAGQMLEEPSVIDQVTGLLLLGVIAVLLSAIIIILIWVLKKRVIKHLNRIESREEVAFNVSDATLETNAQPSVFRGLKRFFNPPEHPIRKIVFQFERKATKFKKGRKPSETVEDWFNRLGLTANIEVYQRVRYGELDVSEEEKNSLKQQLKQMEEIIVAKKA